LFVLATALSGVAGVHGQEEQAAPEGVEVMARGPIHEAYAESLAGEPKEAPVVAKKPPDPIEELPPEQKPEGDNVQWMPGYWAFDEDRNDYLWVSGFWRTPPPNRQWVPGHWKDVDAGGYQWVAGFWGGAATEEVTYLPPPPAPVQVAPPPQPSPNHVYVSGVWVWRDDHYVWRPGYWLECRPNWIWVPSHYVWSPCGYVYVEGYWDYTLKDRGLLFAPVYVSATMIRPGYVYTPTVIVHHECMVGAMFVRPGCRTYYFGDYFDDGHRNGGYVSWCTVSVGYTDPMFSYYRYEHRDDPSWSVSLQFTYTGRYNGTIPRPPVSMNNTVVNNTVINNTVVNNTVINNTNINRTAIASFTASPTVPLSQASSRGLKLQPVPAEARVAHAAAAKQMVQASHQRAQAEREVLAKGPPPTKPTDKPRKAKIDLPKSPANAAAHNAAAPAVTHPAPTPAAHATPAPNHPATPSSTPTPAHAATPQLHPSATPAANHPATPAAAHPATTPAPTHPATPAAQHPATPAAIHPATAPTTHPGTTAPARPGTTPTQPAKPGTAPAKPGTTPPAKPPVQPTQQPQQKPAPQSSSPDAKQQ
jgi:hypothetical protein